MPRERLLPTEEERKEYNRRLDNTFDKVKVAGDKVKVAGAATGAFVAASAVFPPALAGALVTMGETTRQVIKMNLEAIKFYRKYPGLDRK